MIDITRMLIIKWVLLSHIVFVHDQMYLIFLGGGEESEALSLESRDSCTLVTIMRKNLLYAVLISCLPASPRPSSFPYDPSSFVELCQDSVLYLIAAERLHTFIATKFAPLF